MSTCFQFIVVMNIYLSEGFDKCEECEGGSGQRNGKWSKDREYSSRELKELNSFNYTIS